MTEWFKASSLANRVRDVKSDIRSPDPWTLPEMEPFPEDSLESHFNRIFRPYRSSRPDESSSHSEKNNDIKLAFGNDTPEYTSLAGGNTHYQLLDTVPDTIPGPLKLTLKQVQHLGQTATTMPYLTLQTIHLSRLLLHIVLNEVKMIEQSVATEKYPNMIPELQSLIDDFEDLLELVADKLQARSQGHIQLLDELEGKLYAYYEKLCSWRGGLEAVQKTRQVFQDVQRVDRRRYEMAWNLSIRIAPRFELNPRWIRPEMDNANVENIAEHAKDMSASSSGKMATFTFTKEFAKEDPHPARLDPEGDGNNHSDSLLEFTLFPTQKRTMSSTSWSGADEFGLDMDPTLPHYHAGNGVACRYYNQTHCDNGPLCPYSHAPDKYSLRSRPDGKNVCIYYVNNGKCRFQSRECIYSHQRSDLAPWDDQEIARQLQLKLVKKKKGVKDEKAEKKEVLRSTSSDLRGPVGYSSSTFGSVPTFGSASTSGSASYIRTPTSVYTRSLLTSQLDQYLDTDRNFIPSLNYPIASPVLANTPNHTSLLDPFSQFEATQVHHRPAPYVGMKLDSEDTLSRLLDNLTLIPNPYQLGTPTDGVFSPSMNMLTRPGHQSSISSSSLRSPYARITPVSEASPVVTSSAVETDSIINSPSISVGVEFSLEQIPVAQRILDFIQANPTTAIPAALITSELVETSEGRGWCLIGNCGRERAAQKANPAYDPSKDTTSRKRVDHLYDHIRDRHFDRRPFHCSQCSRAFSRAHDLKRHESVHSPTSYSCPHCPRTYTREDNLKRHIGMKHTGMPTTIMESRHSVQ